MLIKYDTVKFKHKLQVKLTLTLEENMTFHNFIILLFYFYNINVILKYELMSHYNLFPHFCLEILYLFI